MAKVWGPQPKQVRFLCRPEYEALYGGAAGGGKSEALVMEAVRQVHIPHYRALLLRKTYPELSELIGKSLNYYPRAFPGAKFNGSAHRWTFPGGATVEFGAMHRTADRLKYQGRTWDFIAFDELTHFTWEEYSYLFSRNRPVGPGTRVYIRATANPGGVGHGWVKERFITAAPPGQRVVAELGVRQPDGTVKTVTRDRVFIPASVYDNKVLLANDPNYIANLSLLPEAERRALLYGDWDSFSGQVFTEWRDDPAHYHDRRGSHVIEPFPVPPDWVIYRGFDWGYSRPFSVGWWAVGGDGCMYRVRELYGCTGEPNMGVKWTPGRLAASIREIEQDDPNLRGRRILGIADPAIWDGSGGESISDGDAKRCTRGSSDASQKCRLIEGFRQLEDKVLKQLFLRGRQCVERIRNQPPAFGGSQAVLKQVVGGDSRSVYDLHECAELWRFVPALDVCKVSLRNAASFGKFAHCQLKCVPARPQAFAHKHDI